MKKVTSLVAVSTLLVGIASLAATPAFAADLPTITRTLPTDNTFYVVECQDYNGQLATLDVATLVATAIGSGASGELGCNGQGAFDPSTGDVYSIAATNFGSYNLLNKEDLTTGGWTQTQFSTATESNMFVRSMAIDLDGNAYAIAGTNRNNTAAIYTLDLSTAVLTYVADVDTGDTVYNSYSFAFNPKDGKFYYESTGSMNLYRIDVTSGATTVVCVQPTITGNSTGTWGIAFDGNGIGWTPDNAIGNLGSFDVTIAGDCGWQAAPVQMTLNNVNWYSEAPAISYPKPQPTPDPELPNTGIAQGTSLALALAAVIALVGGVVLARRVRRTTV